MVKVVKVGGRGGKKKEKKVEVIAEVYVTSEALTIAAWTPSNDTLWGPSPNCFTTSMVTVGGPGSRAASTTTAPSTWATKCVLVCVI